MEKFARAATASVAALALLAPAPPAAGQTHPQRKPSKTAPRAPAKAPAKPPAAPPASDESREKDLTTLARALRDDDTPANYAKLREFANRNAMNGAGARAALALAYHDAMNNHFAQAESWIERAAGEWPKGAPRVEPALTEYALYWKAFIARGLGHSADALSEYEQFRRSYPDSVLTEAALESLAETAMAASQPERAIAALNAYGKTDSRPVLLLRRAQATEKQRSAGGDTTRPLAAAARDYQSIYYRFPLSEEARAAGTRLVQLERALGSGFPAAPLDQRIARADALYDAHRWRDVRAEYELLLPLLRNGQPASSPALARAQVHMAYARVELGAPTGVLADLEVRDSEADAERLFLLAQAYRSRKAEDEALATIDHLASLYPQSYWTGEGLFTAGNILWVKLDRKRAAGYYRRVSEQFPGEKNAPAAQWRLAWTAYLERAPETGPLLEEHVRRFPTSPAVADALYWLGRLAERDGHAAHARSFYLKARDRYPLTYFGMRAAQRLKPPPGRAGHRAGQSRRGSGSDSCASVTPSAR